MPEFIVQMSGRNKLTVPDEVKGVLGVEPGDELVFVLDGSDVTLRRRDQSFDLPPVNSVGTTAAAQEQMGDRIRTGKGQTA